MFFCVPGATRGGSGGGGRGGGGGGVGGGGRMPSTLPAVVGSTPLTHAPPMRHVPPGKCTNVAHAAWLAQRLQQAAELLVVAFGMPTSTLSLQMRPELTLNEASHTGCGEGEGDGGGVGAVPRPPLILSPCFGLVGVAVAFRKLQRPGPWL